MFSNLYDYTANKYEQACYSYFTLKTPNLNNYLPTYQEAQEAVHNAINSSRENLAQLAATSKTALLNTHAYIEAAPTKQKAVMITASAITTFTLGYLSQMPRNTRLPNNPANETVIVPTPAPQPAPALNISAPTPAPQFPSAVANNTNASIATPAPQITPALNISAPTPAPQLTPAVANNTNASIPTPAPQLTPTVANDTQTCPAISIS